MDFLGPDGEPHGFTIDVFKEAARRENVRIVWKEGGNLIANDESLRRGDVDILPSGSDTPKRRKEFYVTEPWWSAEVVAIVPEDSPIRQDSDLDGRRLVASGTILSSISRRYPNAQLRTRGAAPGAVSEVCQGLADAAVVQTMFLRDLIAAHPDACSGTKLRTFDSRAVREYVLVARPGMAGVARALRNRIDKITLDGTLTAIARRNAPISAPEATRLAEILRAEHDRAMIRAALGAMAVGVLVVLGIVVWQGRSRSRLRKLNAELEQAQTERERHLAKLETVLNTLSEGVFVSDLAGTIVYGNRAAREMLPLLSHDAAGGASVADYNAELEMTTPDGEVVPPERWPISRILTGKSFRDSEFRLQRRDRGTVQILLISGALARDRQGNPLLAVASARDITESRRAEQELERQSTLLLAVCDNAPDCIFVKDLEGRTLLANPATMIALGKPAAQVLGQTAQTYLDDPAKAALLMEADRRVVQSGEAQTVEEVVPHPAGDRTFLSTKAPWRDQEGKIIGLVGISHDITERKELEARARQWMRVVEQAELAIAVSHVPTETVQQANETFARQRGYEPAELAGIPITRLYPEEEWPRLREQMRRVAELNHAVFESAHRRKDGSRFPVRVDLTVVLDEHGHPTSRVAFVQDLTEEKRAEQEIAQHQERLTLAEKGAGFGVFEWDVRTGDSIWSDEMKRQYGVSPDVTPSVRLWTEHLLLPEDRESALARAFQLTADDSQVNQFRIRRMDTGEVRWMEARGRVHRDEAGQPVRMIGINTDITERKQAEEEILRLNAELEERVRQRTAQLEAANKELEAFAYSVSHDLRAPLRGIDGWSLALLEDYGLQLDGKAQSYLERVRGEAQRMGVLIDDLLNFSRLGRTPMRAQAVDLTALAGEVAARVIESEPDRKVHLSIHPNLTATGDRVLLEVALTNLLENAMKFTRGRAEARIEFGQVQIDGCDAFFLRDNGAGFDMAHAGNLFGVFQRLHRQSEFPGTGVGLAIVQRIMHRHGGRIWAQAQPGQGATFYFVLGTAS